MIISTGRCTISREEEQRRSEAFLRQHEEQRLACRVGSSLTPEEKVFMRALRPSRAGRPSRLFGDARHEAARTEPVFRGDLEADLLAESSFPWNTDRVGG